MLSLLLIQDLLILPIIVHDFKTPKQNRNLTVANQGDILT